MWEELEVMLPPTQIPEAKRRSLENWNTFYIIDVWHIITPILLSNSLLKLAIKTRY
jgi:hypothetical protein